MTTEQSITKKIAEWYEAAAMNEKQGQIKSAKACRQTARELERELEEMNLDKRLVISA